MFSVNFILIGKIQSSSWFVTEEKLWVILIAHDMPQDYSTTLDGAKD